MLKQCVTAVAAMGLMMVAGAMPVTAAGMGNMGGMKMGPMPKHLLSRLVFIPVAPLGFNPLQSFALGLGEDQ